MRLLIPRVAKVPNIAPVPAGSFGVLLQALEQTQAAQLAGAYINCTQQTVWDKTGVTPEMRCKPIATNPALSYPFPAGTATGEEYGDQTLVCASQG